MSRVLKCLAPAAAVAVVATNAVGQTWDVCIDPMNTSPRSQDWGANSVANQLMRATLGASGTITYGGQNGPCFSPAVTANLRGRIGFAVGSLGSAQSNFDDLMPLTFGMPFDPAGNWSYAMLVNTEPGVPLNAPNPARSLFGANGWNILFNGASDRYIYGETTNDGIRIGLRIDIVGDAARLDWTLTNTTTGPRNLGLWFGQFIAMITDSARQRSGFLGKQVYAVVPGLKPQTVERRFRRTREGDLFPATVNFNFGQTNAYGLKVHNTPSAGTLDPLDPRGGQEFADEIVIGDTFFLLGNPGSGTEAGMPDRIFTPDNDGTSDVAIDNHAYIQKFYPRPIPGGGSRRIVSFYTSTWSVASYTRPYTVVVDSPRLLATSSAGTNGLANNPFILRVWVDNIRGFSTVDQEVPLSDVEVTLTLPPGLRLAPGERARKIIDRIAPRGISFVNYRVVADGRFFGRATYSVRIDPTPGPVKTLSGTIDVAATPRLELQPDANLVGTPFNFSTTSWNSILGLNQPTDFQAFDWDPQQQSYVLSTGVRRGRGTWIVLNRNTPLPRALNGNPTSPTDITTGAAPIQLKSGWNLIANPYPYAFPLGQLVGVSAANPQQAFTWAELVNQGVVSSALTFWNTNGPIPRYDVVEGTTALLQPNVGYWLFVASTQDLTLQWPPIFAEWVPGSNRKKNDWVQSERQWRLQLVARSEKAVDDLNYVGIARSEKDAKALRIFEAPMVPGGGLSAGVEGTLNGRPTRMAQALNPTQGRQTWNFVVNSKEAGPVTVTWPNLGTLPRNVRLRLVDTASGVARDMRRASGYTFNAEAGAERVLKIEATPGLAARALIGNVNVGRQGRSANAPIAITYNLSSDATTTVRVLGSNGREVFTVTRGRADRSGENTVFWALRDTQNRAVAPGVYQVEITAETSEGDRIRRFVPVNVVR